MENDVLIQMVIIFFCIALLTFWFKKRWKKKPDAKVSSNSENRVGGKWTAEPPERSNIPEPEPPERSNIPEPEPPENKPEPKE